MMKRLKLKNKILLFSIFSTLIGLVIEAVLFNNISSNLIFQMSKSSNSNNIQQIQESFDTFVDQINQNITGIYNNRELINDLSRSSDIGFLRTKYDNAAREMATSYFGPTDGLQAFYLYNLEDQLISSYLHAIPAFFGYPTDIYANNGLGNKKEISDYVLSSKSSIHISAYFNELIGRKIFRISKKIYKKHEYSRPIGYVVCDIDSNVIKVLTTPYLHYSKDFLWLQKAGFPPLTEIGQLNEKNSTLYTELSGKIQKNQYTKNETENRSNIGFFQANSIRNDVRFFSLIYQKELYENQQKLTETLIYTSIIIILIISLAALLVSDQITRPLNEMIETIKKIREGRKEIRVKDPGSDEIGTLGDSFNSMLDEIDALIQKKYESELLIRDAEYNALQSQINPHFLYNTLDAMSNMARLSNCPDVSDMSLSLAKMFRYNLDMKNPLSTISREIAHLKNYIYVMAERTHDSVKYEIDLDESISQNVIPKLSIQPIVENALIHGLKNKKGEKNISIHAKPVGNDVAIEIFDNGVGMNPNSLNELLTKDDLKTVKSGDSIGLTNINARIKMLFGEKYGISIQSEIGCGTTVVLMIPSQRIETDS